MKERRPYVLDGARRRAEVAATAHTLDSASVARIQWLFERACRHGYGAEPSLRAAVEMGAARMTAAGASPGAIRDAVIECVVGDGDNDTDPVVWLGESRMLALRRRMMEWASLPATPP